MTKKYELIDHNGAKAPKYLKQLRALRDFGDVKTGDLGGFIESENNLSHEGICWVCDSAQVYDSARVYGSAKVCGSALVCNSALVYGSAKVSSGNITKANQVISAAGALDYVITVTPWWVRIGCECHTRAEWDVLADELCKEHNKTREYLNKLLALADALALHLEE